MVLEKCRAIHYTLVTRYYATTIVVPTTPVWGRLPKLPLPFLDHKVLNDIENNLRTFKKMETKKIEKGLFTFARILLEIDTCKALPDCIKLKHKHF